jgi:uncharacterized phiE125 gp8 family phage protein
MGIKLVTAQTDWVLELPEVKGHLRITDTDEDAFIQELIYAVQAKVEEECDLGLNTATYDLKLDEFPDDEIEIWMWPVASISSVKYIDENGTEQEVSSANYKTELTSKPARIKPYDGFAWPGIKYTYPGAVTVRFITGFTSPAVVPGDLKQAMYLMIADWYDNREDKGRRFQRISERILDKYRYR